MELKNRLAKQLYELSIEYERAEMAGKPVIALANRIATVREMLDMAKTEAPTLLPAEQADLREWFWKGTETGSLAAIPQQPKPQVEPDGDVLWA